MTRHSGVYNLTRQVASLLRRYRKEPPSLIMHLHSAGFRIGNHQDSTLHSYEGDLKCWLDCVREQKIPNELLDVMDELGIRFYEGCLIVEVYEHRSTQPSNQNQNLIQPQTSNPTHSTDQTFNLLKKPFNSQLNSTSKNEAAVSDLPSSQVTSHRVVLSPTCATLWHDIIFMNESKLAQMTKVGNSAKASEYKWGPITQEEAVELEAAILDRTTPALCLSPSIITCRIANQMQNETALQPNMDQKKPRKRPLNSGEKDAIRRQRERRERFMHIADEGFDQAFAPTFSRFDLIKRIRTEHPDPATSRVKIPRPPASNLEQDPPHNSTPRLTIAPKDLYFYDNLAFDLKNEPHQIPSTAGGLNQLQIPASTLPPISPQAPLVSSNPASAPTKKTNNSKKKATTTAVLDEKSETGSPAPSSVGPIKKLSKKAQKQLEMTPEEIALAEEKKKKQAENRRLAKERKAAAAKAQAASLKVASSTTPTAVVPNIRNNSATNQLSIPVPNRSQAVFQSTENHTNGAESSIPVLDSIPILTNNSIPIPNQEFNVISNNNIPVPILPISTSHDSSNILNGIPVHPDLSNNNNHSIPVPSLNNRQPIPVYPNNKINPPAHRDIPIPGSEILPISQDNIPVLPVVMNEMNSIPVPNHQHQHQDLEISSIPVPQPDAQQQRGWNDFGMIGHHHNQQHQPPNQQQQQQQHQHQSNEMDIHVHNHSTQVALGSSLGSIEIPSPHLMHLNQQQPFHFQPGSLPHNHPSNNNWNN